MQEIFHNGLKLIFRYAKSQMTPFPICLYLDEFLSSKFTYRTWLYCRTNSVIIQCIAPKIYFTFKDLSLGVFDQLQPKLDKLLDDRYIPHVYFALEYFPCCLLNPFCLWLTLIVKKKNDVIWSPLRNVTSNEEAAISWIQRDKLDIVMFRITSSPLKEEIIESLFIFLDLEMMVNFARVWTSLHCSEKLFTS